MPKYFDPVLLDIERYPFQVDVATRFADMDINGHINNVAMSAAFEDARARFDFEFCMHETRDHVMTVATYIDYMAQAHYPKPLQMAVGISSIGRSTWVITELGLQNGVACALCRATMVNTDGAKALPLSDGLREVLMRMRMKLA